MCGWFTFVSVKCQIDREKSGGMIWEVQGWSSELFGVLEEGSENNLVYCNTTEVQSERSNQDRLNKPSGGEEEFRGMLEVDSSTRGSQATLIIKLKYISIARSLLYKYPNCYY
jgi:hypothetical protein